MSEVKFNVFTLFASQQMAQKNVQNILITVSSVQSVTAGKMNQTFIWNKAYLLKEHH